MRTGSALAVWVVVAVGACGGGSEPESDTCGDGEACEISCEADGFEYGAHEVWSRGDCGSCSCVDGRAGCSAEACGSPPGVASNLCEPSGICSEGPQCGDTCCGPGERCDGWTCVCGDANRWCADGQTCGSGVPGACGTDCVDA